MDGIPITQIVDEAPDYLVMKAPQLDHLVTNGDVFDNSLNTSSIDGEKKDTYGTSLEAEQIADMIRINEGLEEERTPERVQRVVSPTFKHLEKLTPDIPLRKRMLSTKTLKKSFFKKHMKRNRMYSDDSDAFIEPLRKKIRATQSVDVKNRIADEKRQLKALKKEKKRLEMENLKLKKARMKHVKKLQREAQLLSKWRMSRGIKKRGRPLACMKKLRLLKSELSTTEDENSGSISSDSEPIESQEDTQEPPLNEAVKKKGRPLGKKNRKLKEEVAEDSDNAKKGSRPWNVNPPIPTLVVKTRSGRTRKTKAALSEYIFHSKVANFVLSGGLDASNNVETSEPCVDPPPVRIERRGRKKGWNKKNVASENETIGNSPNAIENDKNELQIDGATTTKSELGNKDDKKTVLKRKENKPVRKAKDKFVMSYRRKKRRYFAKRKQIHGYGQQISFADQTPGELEAETPDETIHKSIDESLSKTPIVVRDIIAINPTELLNLDTSAGPQDSSQATEDPKSLSALSNSVDTTIVKTAASQVTPNGARAKRRRTADLSRASRKAATSLEGLSELRTVWGELMGTSPVKQEPPAPTTLKIDDNVINERSTVKVGVENSSPPAALEGKLPTSKSVKRVKGRRLFTPKKRAKNNGTVCKDSLEPLKETQNIDEGLRLPIVNSTPIKKEKEGVPQAPPSPAKLRRNRTRSLEVPAHFPNLKVVLTKDKFTESSLTSLHLKNEDLEIVASTSPKMEDETKKCRTSSRIRRSALSNKPESLEKDVASNVVSSSPRRSLREVKLTEKMVELISHEKNERKLKTAKIECYENILKRGANDGSEMANSDLGAKVEVLSQFFHCPWAPGDVGWARLGDYPFWPSLVIQDPFCSDEYSKVRFLNDEPHVFIHVQFLHDRGRRAWVPMHYFMAFEGLANFKSLAASQSVESSESTPYNKAFVVKEKYLRPWEEAVKEGESFLTMSAVQRLSSIRRRNPLERYGDCSSLNGKITDIPVEPLPLPSPQPLITAPCSVKKPKKIKTEVISSDEKPLALMIKKEKTKVNRVKSKPVKEAKCVTLTEKLREERAQSEDSSSAFEKESVSSIETLSLEAKRAKKILFKGVGDEKICDICRGIKNEVPLKCKGHCQSFFHPSCLESSSEMPNSSLQDWVCDGCTKNKNPCFVCKKANGTRQMCLTAGCGKFYHHDCLQLFPQTKFNRGPSKNLGLQLDPNDKDTNELPLEILACSFHTCHTCASDNVAECQVVPMDKLVRCVKCPTSYHSGYFCVPAGTEVKTTNQILCGKHFEPVPSSRVQYHCNINWCFICCKGGTLVCCDSCPSAFHEDCLKIKPPEGSYICEECESGRFPLHGEIVWVKLGSYRWWPAKVLYPQEIPQNLANMKRRQCEFAVRFYGSRDYQWVNRGRAFLYQDGDALSNFKIGKRHDNTFLRACTEANADFELRKEAFSQRNTKGNCRPVGKPAPYIKIRTNKYIAKPFGASKEPPVCECDAEGEAPCSITSNCLNRMLLFECDPGYCPAGNACMNRCFEKRQYPPLQIIKTSDRGWGLVSKADISKGQFVIEYVGEVIDEEEFKLRLQRKRDDKDSNFYFLTVDSNRIIDAGPRGNLARFINHSCAPNCETQKWTVNGVTRVGLFAIEDIPKGAELTFNYNLDCLGDARKKECNCGSSSCSGFIGSKPIKVEAEVKLSKKNKAKKSHRTIKATDSACFRCGEGGELMLCDASSCSRACHVACAGLTSWPNVPWYCMSHQCAICKKATKRQCSTCGVAYCASHTQGYIYTDHSGKLFCTLHLNKSKSATLSRRSSYLSRRDLDGVTSSTGSISGDVSDKDNCGLIKEEKIKLISLKEEESQSCVESLHGGDSTILEIAEDEFKGDPLLVDSKDTAKDEEVNLTSTSTSVILDECGSDVEMADLIPATDFNSSSPVVFTDPDGHIIDIDREALQVVETPSKRRKRTNIPRAKFLGLKSPLKT